MTVMHLLNSGAGIRLRAVGVFAVAALFAGVLTACAPEPHEISPSHAPAASAPKQAPSLSQKPSDSGVTRATFLSVVDGDTIETSAGTVRLIGVDTPERGECGHDIASTAIGKLVSRGDAVELVLPDGQHDEDRYNRLLRYITVRDGIDLGLMQLKAGNAIARYDSRDGYPKHPNEARYREAQIATAGPDRKVITTSCAAEQVPPPAPEPAPAPAPGPAPAPAPQPAPVPVPSDPAIDTWWTQYPSCTKLKKNIVGHPKGPFNRDTPDEVEIYKWFAHSTGNRGDGDDDGLACE